MTPIYTTSITYWKMLSWWNEIRVEGAYLFLDRDGVINRRIPDGYVQAVADFHLLPGVLEALVGFSQLFDRIVIVTNQQGIGKGIMTEADLQAIHSYLKEGVQAEGGRVDGIYYCPQLASVPDNCRKPAPQMAYAAREDFPEIDFSRSLMVGDNWSDIAFGKGIGMKAVLLRTALLTYPNPYRAIPDLELDSLWELWQLLKA